jgi:hypothetical protein
MQPLRSAAARYAPESCSRCGLPTTGTRCPTCGGSVDRRSASTTARGYGWKHQRRRAALLPLAYGTACPLCGEVMLAHQALDLHHPIRLVDDSASVGTQIVHASCNRGRK